MTVWALWASMSSWTIAVVECDQSDDGHRRPDRRRRRRVRRRWRSPRSKYVPHELLPDVQVESCAAADRHHQLVGVAGSAIRRSTTVTRSWAKNSPSMLPLTLTLALFAALVGWSVVAGPVNRRLSCSSRPPVTWGRCAIRADEGGVVPGGEHRERGCRGRYPGSGRTGWCSPGRSSTRTGCAGPRPAHPARSPPTRPTSTTSER